MKCLSVIFSDIIKDNKIELDLICKIGSILFRHQSPFSDIFFDSIFAELEKIDNFEYEFNTKINDKIK